MNTLATFFCVAAISLGASACGRGDNAGAAGEGTEAAGTAGATDAAGGNVAVADIAAAPNTYFGRTVTVVADVEEVFGPRAFALDEDAFFRAGIDNDLLVVGKDTSNLSDIDDQWLNNKARVTGTVGRLTVVDIEREVGWDLDPQLELEIERSGAVLIASSVERVQQSGNATQRQDVASTGAGQNRSELPDTASSVALTGLVGCLLLGAAIAVRVLAHVR